MMLTLSNIFGDKLRKSILLLLLSIPIFGAYAQEKLLVSEVVITPTAGEYVEIYNPSDTEVNLDNYYLYDATFAGASTFYYNIVTGSNAGGGSFSDFHAKFPAGTKIKPKSFITVAIAGSEDFKTQYGKDPDFELYEDGSSADAVPDMMEAFSGSINNQGGLTNGGETLVLYYWDGASDLVTDIDYILWGDKAEATVKTGVSIDGPDAGTGTSTYKDDKAKADQSSVHTGGHTSGNSFQRLDFSEGKQVKTGGNGVSGRDETSEDLATTFTHTKAATPGTGVPVQKLLLSEIVVTPTANEFIEIYNPNSEDIYLDNYYLFDATHASSGNYYYNIVTGNNAGGGGFSDFHARFPVGAKVKAGGYITVAIAGSDDFSGAFGKNPDFELYEDGSSADTIPDMMEALSGSINNQGGLTNGGETVVLYFWDGNSDLVTDVDYVIWGDKAEATDKSSIATDGPDDDANTSAYQNDTPLANQEIIASSAHSSGASYQRVDFTEGTQTNTGGNGVNGRNESSENISSTFVRNKAATPGTGLPPEVTITESITSFTAISGKASASQSYTVAGNFLTAPISIKAPANFEISTDNTTFVDSLSLSPASAAVQTTTIHVRVKSTAPLGAVSGNIVHKSAGVTDGNIALTGTVNMSTDPLAALGASMPASLSETNLNGAKLGIKLTNEEVADTVFDASNFMVKGLTGASVASARGSQDSITLTLAFDSTDFDVDSMISIMINPAELKGTTALTTGMVKVTAMQGLNSIAALRALGNGATATLESEAFVVISSKDRNQKWIVDATGGIVIDDASNVITTPYFQGAGMRGLQGTLSEYRGLLQFVPSMDPGAPSSTGNNPMPTTITMAQLNSGNFQGQLVTIEDAELTQADGTKTLTTSGGDDFGNYVMSVGGTTGVCRVEYSDADYLGMVIPSGKRKITGVVSQFNSTHQLIPTRAKDLGLKTVVKVYTESFTADAFKSPVLQWSHSNVKGASTGWAYRLDDAAMRMNAYPSNCEGDDWLISPKVSLDSIGGVKVKVSARTQYDGNNLELHYAKNYIVGTKPDSATLVKIGDLADQSGRGPFDLDFNVPVSDTVKGKINFFVRYVSTSGSGCAEWFVKEFAVTADTFMAPIVQFSSPVFTSREGDGKVKITVNMINPSTSSATTVTVKLATGNGADINGFTSKNITFPAGSSAPIDVELDITDDALEEGTEVLVFALENPSSPAIIGTTVRTALSIGDNDFSITRISAIQGKAHTSPMVDADVKVEGIVTAKSTNGFYLHDMMEDSSVATSEAVFVFTSTSPAVAVGDKVEVIGTVEEREGNANEYTRTQIGKNPLVKKISSGNALPAPIVIGIGGRVAPNTFINSDPNTFDPKKDGADFYESLENMRVKIQKPMAVSPYNRFDIYVVADNGATATGISKRGTINIGPGDLNPEKMEIDPDTRIANVSIPNGVIPGTELSDIIGIVSYDRGVYEITPLSAFTVKKPSTTKPITTKLAGSPKELLVGSYNVLNLDPNDASASGDEDIKDGRFGTIARHIVFNMNKPDIIGLQEIQDNSGSVDDGTISADQTLQLLIDSIQAVGGPTYKYIDNTFIGDKTSGGDPAGNIRTAFLYNDARVDLVAGSVQTISSQKVGDAFQGARLPIVATFTFHDTAVTIINNHFSSKGGSAPIYGQLQPFGGRQEDTDVNGSLDERQRQSRAVQAFIDSVVKANPSMPIVNMGDLNEFEFVSPVTELEKHLVNLTDKMPANERYTYSFQGNSQALDHIMVSKNLFVNAKVEVVHVNNEFVETDATGSDHDPIVALLDMGAFPVLPSGEGQSTVAYQIQNQSDDAEEYLPGAVDAFRKPGQVDLTSSDIELGKEENKNPQLTGLRFAGIDIPKNAVIVSAHLEFTVDATGDNTDPANYYILAENNSNPATYTADSLNISSRNYLMDSVKWNVKPGSWATVGESGPDQRTTELKSLVQQLVNKSDWSRDNAIAFMIGGTGTREAESYSTKDKAARFVVNYIPVTTNSIQIASENDDAEEYLETLGSRTKGQMDLNSSDIELGQEGANGAKQISALRFANLNIPKDAEIVSARIQFTVDATNENVDPANFFIKMEDNVNPGAYTSDNFNITSRTYMMDSVQWNIKTGSWDKVGDSGADQTTAELKAMVQKMVNKPDWKEGNAMAFTFQGTGVREAESFRTPDLAAMLLINFIPKADISIKIADHSDDAEEALETARFRTVGQVDLTSSDIELGLEEGDIKQLTGLRFRNIPLPKGAVIESASIQFTVDAFDENEDPANFYVLIQDTTNAPTYSASDFNISSRRYLKDTVKWNVGAGTWASVGEKGSDQATPDLKMLLQKIVDRNDWVEGNSIAFAIGGEGTREAESFSTPDLAPELRIRFLQGAIPAAKPKLSREIPDLVTRAGYAFDMDMNGFIKDADSKVTFHMMGMHGTKLPMGISMTEDGMVSGKIDKPMYAPIMVSAVSFGDTLNAKFNLIVKPAPTKMLKQISSVKLGAFDEGAAEISAYDPSTKLLFVTNAEIKSVEVLDFTDPANPTRMDTIDISAHGAGVNSVAVANGKLAIAVENNNKQQNGVVTLYNTTNFKNSNDPFLFKYTVGALPDMVTFDSLGGKIIVANEGEPNDDYNVDPEGSVSVITLPSGNNYNQSDVATVNFQSYNSKKAQLIASGARIFGPNATVAQDLEPEYITVKGNKAYVTLQENNALAVVDIASASLDSIFGLGYKDHSIDGQGIDVNNDKESDIFINNNLPFKGMYQPDAITSITMGGKTYLLTANEGDARDYDGYKEEGEVTKDLKIDENFIPNAAHIKAMADGLTITNVADTSADGSLRELITYGTRSFTIWDAATGKPIYDSGDDFEQITAAVSPKYFNASNDNEKLKNRSDNKGPEPEAITVGKVGAKNYAFIGLERVGGIMVYDITDINKPKFVEYFNNRDFTKSTSDSTHGDSGPEGMVFIPAAQSPNSKALLVVSNEVSGTVTTYEMGEPQKPFTLTLFHNNDGESFVLPDSVNVNGKKILSSGAGQFVATVKRERKRAADEGRASLMLSSGDNFLAGVTYNASVQDGIYYDAVLLDSIGYDAIDLGNHDFDFGTKVLADFIKAQTVRKAPYLSSNLDFKNVPEMQALVDSGRVAPRTIVEKNGEKIGIIGLTTDILATISSPGETIIQSGMDTIVQAQVDALEKEGVNKIVLISHLQGLDTDKDFISKISGIDIVIAGGGDELLTNDPTKGDPFNLTVVGDYPLTYKDKTGKDIIVVTTPGSYRYLGNLTVDFDAQGNVIEVLPSDVILITGAADSGVVKSVEEPVQKSVEAIAKVVLARTEVEIDYSRDNLRKQETNGGNLFADALLWQAKKSAPSFGVKTPQIALQNAGGLRLENKIPANTDITELTTFQLAAFTNVVSVIEDITAAQLKEVFEHGIARSPTLDGRFPHIAGFSIEYDRSKNPGEKIVTIMLDDSTALVKNGKIVANAPTVTMASIDFTLGGGDAYPFKSLGLTNIKKLGATYQQAFSNYLKATDGLNGLVKAADYPEVTTGFARIDTVSAADPMINVTASLNAFSTTEGTASASQSYSVAGSDLTAAISIKAPTHFELSLDNSTFADSIGIAPTQGSVAATTVHVRVKATAPQGAITGNIMHLSTRATDVTTSLSGTVNAASTTAISATDYAAGLSLYPNPVHHVLTIEHETLDIKFATIYSINGAEVLSTTLEFNQIDLSELKAGLYILELKDADNTTIRTKLLKD